jgi:hypothetical protein
MVPASFHTPAALALAAGGALACFFGYRLFRLVLAVFGFILGAFAATSMFGAGSSVPTVVMAVVGGLAGAGLLMAAYFVGVALVGAGLGAAAANLLFTAQGREPTVLMVVLFSIAGAVGSMYLQRYFIIVGTAFGGAWTLVVGALAMAGDRAAMAAASAGKIWVLYPLNPAPGRTWVSVVWIVLGVIGLGVQLGWTAGNSGRVGRRKRNRRQ